MSPENDDLTRGHRCSAIRCMRLFRGAPSLRCHILRSPLSVLPETAESATIIYAPSSGRAVHTETLRASDTRVCFAADCRYFHVSAFVACASPDGAPGTL